jgi:hypothetical protein
LLPNHSNVSPELVGEIDAAPTLVPVFAALPLPAASIVHVPPRMSMILPEQ